GSHPPPSDPDTNPLPPVEFALSARPESAPALQIPPLRTDTVRATPPAPRPRPPAKLHVPQTRPVHLVAPDRRLRRRRTATALGVALTFPAIVAVVIFTLEASTSRAALDRKRLALGVGPPSEPT